MAHSLAMFTAALHPGFVILAADIFVSQVCQVRSFALNILRQGRGKTADWFSRQDNQCWPVLSFPSCNFWGKSEVIYWLAFCGSVSFSLLETVLSYINTVAQSMEKNADKLTGKFWRALLSKAYDMLDKVGFLGFRFSP